MKRLLGFLIVAVFAACTCLSQIPDQLVYVDQNCEALLPDYTPDVVVVDNCDNATINQVPSPGITLTSAQPTTQVVITANDISGNSASISFNVILVDTIAPTIEAGPGLLTYDLVNHGKLHKLFHAGIVASHDSLMAMYPDQYDPADTNHRTDNLVTVSNLKSNIIAANFVNPEWVTFSADSAYVVDSLGIAFTTVRIEFLDN